jgi:hypothetical protein
VEQRGSHDLSVGSARTNGMSATCRECGADIEHEHCHGTVILHIGQRPECTEDDCDTPEAVHSYFIDCFAVDCGCAEGQPIGPAVSAVSFSSASG